MSVSLALFYSCTQKKHKACHKLSNLRDFPFVVEKPQKNYQKFKVIINTQNRCALWTEDHLFIYFVCVCFLRDSYLISLVIYLVNFPNRRKAKKTDAQFFFCFLFYRKQYSCTIYVRDVNWLSLLFKGMFSRNLEFPYFLIITFWMVYFVVLILEKTSALTRSR